MSQYISVDEVVRSVLIEEGQYTNHKLLQYTDFAVRTLKELNFDILQNIKAVELYPHELNATRYDLPKDFVNYTRVGVCANGKVSTLANAPNLCTVEAYDDCGYVVNRVPNPSTAKTVDTVYWFDNIKNGEYIGKRFGYRGGQSNQGYYRIDREANQLVVSSADASSPILLEYITDGSQDYNNLIVHVFAEEALRAGIRMRSLRMKRNIPMGEKEIARRDFYNEKRLARARLKSFTKEEAMRMARRGIQSAPKF